MADWRDNLRPASFRGVPFFVKDPDMTGGRRGPDHQFGGRDTPYAEDLGRDAHAWEITGYVIGDDFMAKRDALQGALDTFGPGEFVHPYYGRLKTVMARRWRVTHRNAKGRYAEFRITFRETGEIPFPTSRTARPLAVNRSADAAATSAVDVFGDLFAVGNKPAFVLDDATNVVQGFLTDLQKQAGAVRAEIAPAWTVINRISDTYAQVATLARTPASLAGQIRSAIDGFASLIPGGLASFRPLLDFSLWGDPDPGLTVTTPSRVQVARNQEEIVRLVRRSSTAGAATKLTENAADGSPAFASLEGALAARDEVLTAVDAEIASAGARGEHGVFVAFNDLRAETVRYMNEEATRLPGLRGWTPASTLPAAAIAYRLYDDAARAGEIAARNRIRHPGFVPGGAALQVLDA